MASQAHGLHHSRVAHSVNEPRLDPSQMWMLPYEIDRPGSVGHLTAADRLHEPQSEQG